MDINEILKAVDHTLLSQTATWEEALNENFVLQKDQKQSNKMARKQYLF